MKTQKMVKIAKVLEKAFKVLQRVALVCIVVAIVLLAAFTAMNALNHPAILASDFNTIGIGPFTFEFAEDVVPNDHAMLLYAWSMAAAAVVFVLLICYTLGIFRKILKPMAEANPFAPGVNREIRKLAFMSLAIGAVYNLFGIIETLNFFHVVDLNSLLQNSRIQSVTPNYTVNVGYIVVFFVLLLLSYIFRYGEELQKLSDETL